MDRFPFPADLIRAQQMWHDTYRALAAPRPAVPPSCAACSTCRLRSTGIRSGPPAGPYF
ncbi:hypothetical protein ACN24M_00770 [Streptomyces microflavus]